MSNAKTAAVSKKAPKLILTKPNTGNKSKSSDKLSVGGHETLISSMRERLKKIDSLSAQQKKDKEVLTEAIKAYRLSEEKAGNFHKTVLVDSDDGKPGQVIFQDKFSKIDVEHEPALREGLNGNFDTLMKRAVDVKAKKGVTLDTIKKALGPKAFAKLEEVSDFTEYLTLSSDFMAKRAAVRPTLDDDTNEFIDGIVDQSQYAPSVKLK